MIVVMTRATTKTIAVRLYHEILVFGMVILRLTLHSQNGGVCQMKSYTVMR